MTSSNKNEKGTPSSGSRIRGNLGALGTAAVLAVYSAGFVRTKAAADRFAVEDRRPGAPAVPDGASIAGTGQVTAPQNDTYSSSSAGPASLSRTQVSTEVRTEASAHPAKAERTSVVHAPAIGNANPSAASNDNAAAASPDVAATPESSAPIPVAPVAPVEVAGIAATDSASVEKHVAKWKDGVFLGWGTSRHGDIQASVEIRNGIITAATIVQCRTQYSCSRIDSLPPEVIARQSADIDYVSRATQSSNAFYYAITNALSQAK